VLEQVREAGAALGLEPEADAVGGRDAEGGARVVFGDHDREAVAELLRFERQLEAARLRGRRGRGGGRHGERQHAGPWPRPFPTPRPRRSAENAEERLTVNHLVTFSSHLCALGAPLRSLRFIREAGGPTTTPGMRSPAPSGRWRGSGRLSGTPACS